MHNAPTSMSQPKSIPGIATPCQVVSGRLKAKAALHIPDTLLWPTRQRGEPGLQTPEMLGALWRDPAEPMLIRGRLNDMSKWFGCRRRSTAKDMLGSKRAIDSKVSSKETENE